MDDEISLALCGYDEDAALVMLCDMVKDKKHYPPFDFYTLSEKECVLKFRFQKDDILHLKDALHLPNVLKCVQGTRATGVEALCIVLRRLAYPNRLSDISPIFGRSQTELSLIFNTALNVIHDNYHGKLSSLDQEWIKPNAFAAAISDKGSPLKNIWGFIDGTVRPICRPTEHQQVVYNGHKRTHAITFQSVITPNGLIADLFGPFEGRRHDCALLEASGLIERISNEDKYRGYSLYGDPAYPLSDKIIVPFRGAHVTAEQEQFNKAMAKLRESVEWEFKDIIVQFAFLDFKKNLKLFLQPVGKYYLVSALLQNCRTCLYGNQISRHFDLEPPSLAVYLG